MNSSKLSKEKQNSSEKEPASKTSKKNSNRTLKQISLNRNDEIHRLDELKEEDMVELLKKIESGEIDEI